MWKIELEIFVIIYWKDFEATVFCHEYDHLNGILHMDISKQIFEMTLEEMRLYRLSHPYEIVSKIFNINNSFRNSNLNWR